MDAKDFAGVLLAVLVPIVTATVGALGVAFQDWRRGRTRLGRRKAALEDARAQVSFVADWWTATRSLDLPQESAAAATRQAHALLDRASSAVSLSQLPPPRSLPPLTLRRVLLLYPFTSWAGRCVRAVFFIGWGLVLVILGASITVQLAPERGQDGWVNAYLVIGATLAALTLGLRFLAVEVEEDASTAASRGETTWGFLRRMLLLYPFHRLPGRLVRVLFYVTLAAFCGYIVWAIEWMVYGWSLAHLPSYGADAFVLGLAVMGVRSWAVSLEAPAGSSSLRSSPAPS